MTASGGIHAIRGFNYQDTVILDILMTHFQEHGASSSVRPEGIDDLELTWIAPSGAVQKRFVQVKKPREDAATKPTHSPWTLGEVIKELIPGTLRRLEGNAWTQHWILGDEIQDDVLSLVAAGSNAVTLVPHLYWLTVHCLARNQVAVGAALESHKRRHLMSWRPDSQFLASPAEVSSHLVADFGAKLKQYISVEKAEEYRRFLNHILGVLPDVLCRIHVHPKYGSEENIAEKVKRSLQQQYDLAREVVSDTLFRNLRGYVSDIASIPDRRFGPEEYEAELRAIWPTMVPIRNPPPLDARHLRRPDVSSLFTSKWSGRALELLGISGAGKTMLAAEVCERSRIESPGRRVFYLEVKPTTELRDVLIGIAFRLRRFGAPYVFGIASRHAAGETAHEVAIKELATGIADSRIECLLMLDMIDGSCSESFARDLKALLSVSDETLCRLAVLGQDSTFRNLTDLERRQFGVKSYDLRGFHFEEFQTLVGQRHHDYDHEELRAIFHNVSAGRSAGLYAGLAVSLANASSLEEMGELSRTPPEQLLQNVERTRFWRMSNGARAAAEKLVCFALAFGRSEAEAVFREVNVGLAIVELLELGLLRRTADDRFEMHETVRAGLEGQIAISTRRQAHASLADHYADKKMVATEVYHLERSGARARAQSRAREAFLSGECWPELCGYVVRERLVTAVEVLSVAGLPKKIEGIHLLPDLITKIARAGDATRVVNLVRTQISRFAEDFNWALAIARAYLALKPDEAHELYGLALCATVDDQVRKNCIGAVLVASGGRAVGSARGLLELYDQCPPQRKSLLVPALLERGGRECLKRAFEMTERHPEHQGDSGWRKGEYPFLRVDSANDVVEFLASMPNAPNAGMIALKSPLLGGLSSYVWRHRERFDEHCVSILRSENGDPIVQKAAIRVLAFTGNAQLCDLCDAMCDKPETAMHGFAALAPSLSPGVVDVDRYVKRATRQDISLPLRVAALKVAASCGADLDDLYTKMCDQEVNSEDGRLEFMFLFLACEYPFRRALSIVERRLSERADRGSKVLVAALRSLGSLDVPDAMAMLTRAIGHDSREVRLVAALSLEEKRSRRPLVHLVRQLHSEGDEQVRAGIAAICASGPTSVECVTVPFGQFDAPMRWQICVAGRTRDESFAERLVDIATDSAMDWKLRREAIHAAGFLPYEVALERIIPAIRDQLKLDIDDHWELKVHSFLSFLLGVEAEHLLAIFVDSKERFVRLVGEIYEENTRKEWDKEKLPGGDSCG